MDLLKQFPLIADDEDAGLRRISYIKATKEDRIQAGIDSDDFEDEIILGIEHDYDITNSGEFSVPVSSSSQQQHKQHKRYFSFPFSVILFLLMQLIFLGNLIHGIIIIIIFSLTQNCISI